MGLVLAAAATASAENAPGIVKKGTWLETVLANHEAVTGREEQQSKRPRLKRDAQVPALWQLTEETSPDALSFRLAQIEERAGIWKDDWKTNDWPALAERYARSSGKLTAKARELAKTCKSLDDLKRVRDLFYVQYAESRIAFAEETLAYVERAAARPELAARLKALRAELPAAEQGNASGEALYAKACDLRREIILSHPLLDFPKLLINKRTDHLPEHMCDQYLGRHSQPAPGLVVLENWKGQAKETVLLEGKLPRGAALQPDLSYDGGRVLFAYADHSVQKDSRLRGYYIYEYEFATGKVRQITGTDRDPMQGRDGRETVLIEDTAPCYLPDGGFAFISTRSQQFGRCHGGRYVPSYTLFRAETDGTRIEPLSLNESNEWAPHVLNDGSLAYCRWDYVDRHDVQFQSLWTMRPDGTQTAHYYGNNSPAPCLISEPQPIPGGNKTVCTCGAHHGQTLGTLVVVDPNKGQDSGEPLTWITPELGFPESGVPAGITKARMPPPEDAHGGRASTAWPLSEDLFLCSYQHGAEHAIYLIDTLGGRELIYADPKVPCFDPMPLRPRPQPPIIPSVVAEKPDQKTGFFFVQNVYESTQPIPPGTIKAMRINEIISQPTNQAPGRSYVHNEVVKRILGTVPVNEDGSVAFEAPARTPVQLQLLDANGMAVMTMRSLVYVQPGEKAACVGCHEPRQNAPPAAAPRHMTFLKIAPPVGPRYDGGFSYVRTVQPVLDRYCIRCHGAGDAPRGLDLTGAFFKLGKDGKRLDRGEMSYFSASYESFFSVSGLIKVAQRNSQTIYSKPMDYFANAGRLGKMLLDGHPDKAGAKRVQLDRDSFQRIVDWLDLNAQFFGDYSFNRMELQTARGDGEKALRAAIEKRFGADLARQPFAALVNVANVPESRILMAPLPAAAGGWGQIAAGAFAGRDDPAYKEMCQLVAASITPLATHDIAGTCGRDDRCMCGDCWVRKAMDARRQRLAEKPADPAPGQPVASR
jgi:hypothetical protein